MLVFSCFIIYPSKWGAHNKPSPNCYVMIDIILLHFMAAAVDQADGSSPEARGHQKWRLNIGQSHNIGLFNISK